MTTRTCLRCDWQAETNEKSCPRCAEPLYEVGKPPSDGAGAEGRGHPEERSREAASTPIVAPSAAPPRRSAIPSEPEHDAAEPSTTRSRSLVAFVLTALVLVFALGSWLKAHTPAEKPTALAPASASASSLIGTLIYSVPEGPDGSRLWRWDLATGRAARGPLVTRAVELVDARGANFGWIGVTSELHDGQLQASVLRFLGPDDRSTPIFAGDMVSWGPGGGTVIAGRRGPLQAGCHRRISIVWAKLVPALRERKYVAPAVCGDLLSIGEENAATLFTLQRHGRVGIFFAGVGRIHSVLQGSALVAVSGLSDLIVVDGRGLPSLGPLPLRPGQEYSDLQGVGLYFQGLGEPRPIPYVSNGEGFAIDRVLAWSPDASIALVEGRLGDQHGLYELDTGPGDGLDAPTWIGPAQGIPYATFTHEGNLIVETLAGLFTVVEDRLIPLTPPAAAPAPAGPIVWIR
jgi:hypothetical protein